jgi:hypothetical protein
MMEAASAVQRNERRGDSSFPSAGGGGERRFALFAGFCSTELMSTVKTAKF